MSIQEKPYDSFLKTLLLLVACALSNQSYAQKFDFGLKAAGSYNNFYGQGTSSFLPNAVYGGSAGVYGTFEPFFKFKIRAEALLSSRGLNSQYNSVGGTSSSLYSGQQTSLSTSSSSTGSNTFLATLNQQTIYLDVPVGVDYEIIPQVNLQAGGMLSIFMNEWSNSLSNNSTPGLKQPADTKYYQQFQFYGYAGAYYRFYFGLSAGVRANVGLTNTFVTISSGTGTQLYPYSLQVFLTYSIFKF